MDACLSTKSSRPRSEPPAAPRAASAPLTPPQLLILELLGRGYSLAQIAALRHRPAADVIDELRRAAAALSVGTAPAAVAEAKRRRLIS